MADAEYHKIYQRGYSAGQKNISRYINELMGLRTALQQIAAMDPEGQRADDLGRAARIARTYLDTDGMRADAPRWHFEQLEPSRTILAIEPGGERHVVKNGDMNSLTGMNLLGAMTKALTHGVQEACQQSAGHGDADGSPMVRKGGKTE